jgi:hypothetical protein
MKTDEMTGHVMRMTGHVMRMTEKKNTLKFWWRSLKDAGLLENLGRGMKMILKYTTC